ncbi:MAG: hypothetical protein ACRDYV_11250 [Acidimicrobiia bacterium]
MARVDTDQDNLRAALEWLSKAGEVEACLQVASGLSRFWGLTGRVLEGRAWLERALDQAGETRSNGMVGHRPRGGLSGDPGGLLHLAHPVGAVGPHHAVVRGPHHLDALDHLADGSFGHGIDH